MFYSSWFSFPGCQICLAHYAKGVLQLLILTHRVMLLVRQPPNNSNLVVFSMSRVTVVKGFFYFIFLHHNHFQERVKMQWTNTKQHIVCSQTHLLAIRNKDIVMHFCIYLHLLLFSNSKAMSIFYIQSTYRASLLWPFQELMFFAFLHIIVLFQCLFFFVSFLFFIALLFGKKRSCPSRYIHYMPCWFSQATMQNYAPY